MYNRRESKDAERSLVLKYMPKKMWQWMTKKTSYGNSIIDCVNIAISDPKLKCGLYAPDAEAYDFFSDMFHPVISDYHQADIDLIQSVHDYGDSKNLENLPIEYSEKVVSIVITVRRTIKGFPMASKLTPRLRSELEMAIKKALESLEGDLAGIYLPLNKMSAEQQKSLIIDNNLYNDAECLITSGAHNDWPNNRGIFMNKEMNFFACVNEEDHIRIICVNKNADIKSAWERLIRAITALDSKLDFEKHNKFGYLNFSPINIGTSLRITIQLQLTNIGQNDKLDRICKELILKSELSDDMKWYFDISNKVIIGQTEWNIVNSLWNGVRTILDMEMNRTQLK